MNKKITIPSEIAYLFACITISFSVAMITTTDFGVSMIVAPAYILSQKIVISFGQSEYIIQALLFILLCLILRKFKIVFFASFVTGLIYGAILDFWRIVIPHFNPNITPVGSLPFELRIVYFIIGALLTSFSVAVFFKTYIYPQVYDFFVKAVSTHFNANRTIFKTCFDCSCLLVAVVMSLVFFGSFVGIGFGTLIMACLNGFVIGFFSRFLDKFFVFQPIFKNFSNKFAIE
ncbi:MAG: hypothetical protein IJO19_01710 [Clostridia bacterium]|nr:hypothetical protein [Clostridia bacterium]